MGPFFCMLAVLVLAAPAHAAGEGQRAERPTYAIGERWVRTDGAYELVRIEGGTYVFLDRGREIHLSRDLSPIRVRRGERTIEFQPALPLGWPLEVGKSGSIQGTLRPPGAPAGVPAVFAWSVEALEDVTVAAGTFKAFRIVHRVELPRPRLGAALRRPPREGPGAREFVSWYAPDVRQFVKGEGREFGLLTYETVAIDRPPGAAVAARPSRPGERPRPPAVPPGGASSSAAPGTPGEQARLGEATPLTIAVRYPAEQARLGEEASVVAAVVSSIKGVARVTVSLNGAEVHDQRERAPARSLVVAAPLTLRDGDNTIVITATEADGTTVQERRTVVLDRARGAAPPPAPPAPSRERWAVVIGVGRYASTAIPKLRYTVPDADAVYDTLVGTAGFKKEHVLLLTDTSERKPTLRNIKWALGTFLARSAGKDDTVFIFFAGHGAPEVDPRGVERDGLAKYLIPSDADPDDLYSTALPMDELQTVFARIEAERVVAFIDACYSGAAGGRTFVARKTRAASVDDLFLERITRSKGRAIITASRPSEVSIELPDLGHGIFTYYLVSGLKGAADLNRDGMVTLQELYEYVEQQVTAKSRAVGGNQHPVMKGELEGVLPLVRVRTP